MCLRFRSLLLASALGLSSYGCMAATDAVSGEEETIAGESALGPKEPLGPEPHGSPAQYPFVLAHGFNASPTKLGFYRVADALRADGHAVYEDQVPPFQSADVRAGWLRETVDRALAETGAAKVNVFAHSMGGLDARALISKLGYGDRVATLTTISTPHRGSAVADIALGLLGDAEVQDEAIDALAKVWARTYSDVADDTDVRAALVDLSEANAEDWNATHPDDPRVVYMSWAGVSNFAGIPNQDDDEACEQSWLTGPSGRWPSRDVMSALFFATAPFVAHGAQLLPNDGLVTVKSASWGVFNACIPADHADEIGQLGHDKADPMTGFDHRRFYRNLAFYYASLGY